MNLLRMVRVCFIAAALIFLTTSRGLAGGTWTPLVNTAPGGVGTMLLLSDGTVMGGNGANGWFRLTPDSSGSYVKGTWSTMPSMNFTRLYFSSQVLTNGQVLVAGAEYGTGTTNSEVYDPVANKWTIVPIPPGLITTNNVPNANTQNSAGFMDSISEILPNGNVMVAPVYPATNGMTVIYNPAAGTWSAGPMLFRGGDQSEASWVKLPDDSIVTIDPYGENSERYIPSLNQWINDGNVPVALYDSYGDELGAGFLLPDGQAFFLGSSGNTALYTPAGGTNMGSWVAGPVIPNGQSTPDAPAAMMVNGKILCAVALAPYNVNNIFNSPTSFYEYDPVTNGFAQVIGPTGTNLSGATYVTRMLDLPDGTVLFANSGAQLYTYKPAGTPLAAGQPAINVISPNTDGSFTLSGTLLNGISEGAGYGDDAQMNSNYPLVRMTNMVSGLVYYARTYNWSSTSVMTGNEVMTTQFKLPAGAPAGNYYVVAVANGNASSPVPFSTTPSPLAVFLPPSVNKNAGTLTNAGAVLLSSALTTNLVVTLTASAPTELLIPASVTIPAGQTLTNFNVTPVEDYTFDGNQTVTVTASAPGYTNFQTSVVVVDDDLPPTIVAQPVSDLAEIGTAASFAVTVTGKAPLSYAWMRNGVPMPGVTNATYTTNNVQFANSGTQYTCVITNAFGYTNTVGAVLTVGLINLVQNGGFETGDLTDWTQSGNTTGMTVQASSTFAHSGTYGLAAGPTNSLGFLLQTVPTVVGQNYLLSFWLQNPVAGSGSSVRSANYERMQTIWNGTTVYGVTNPPVLAWTNVLRFVTATGASTVLQFGFQDNPYYFALDDVSVMPVLPVGFQALQATNNTVQFSWNAQTGLVYQVQYTTNLVPAAWLNLGGTITTNGATAMATDALGGPAQRFYRILVLP